MASQLFLVLFAVATTVKSQVLPTRCNTIKVQCVGEGSTCSADWYDTCEGYTGSWSLCQKCADDTLVCHGGKCMKRTQGRGEQCDNPNNPTNHLWCQPAFSCSGGVCVDPTLTQPTNFLARGETCSSNNDCSGYTQCDDFVHKCVNDNLDATTQQLQCYAWADCQWNEYCSPQDTTATPNIVATCKPEPGGFGNRGGSLCKIDNPSNPSGQCGWTQFCVQHNQDETDASHTMFTSTTCTQPYSIPEGGMCPQDIPSGTVSIGGLANNGNPISFCATGPCVNSGNLASTPYSAWRCSSADYTYAGTGCSAQNQCGRGMDCLCPDQGGSRQRCMPDATHQAWERGRQDWFSHFQPWLSCLENNQCTLNDVATGSCGYTHCQGYTNYFTSYTSCQLSDPYPTYVDAPSYHGYHDTISAASSATPSFVAMAVITFIYALVH